jgi:hypothetical protein
MKKPSDAPKDKDPGEIFSIEVRQAEDGRILVVGRPTRKRATTFLNIPIDQQLHDRLQSQCIGSLAMCTSALLQWALQELERQGISLEALPRS